MRRRTFAVLAAVALSADAANAEIARTWSGIIPGPHPVSMTLSEPAEGYRQIVWAPAAHGTRAATLAEAAARLCPEAVGPALVRQCFPDLVDELSRRGRSSIDRDLDTLGAQSLGASLNSPRKPGRFPVVLLQGSIASRGGEFFSIGEALASRGYEVVVVVESTPAPQPVYDARAVARARRGLDLARPGPSEPYALVAWSFGGVPAALEALEPHPPRAFASLDSALRYTYGVQLLRAEAFEPEEFDEAFLSVTPGVGNRVPQDDAIATAMGGSTSRAIVADGLRHGDFSDQRGALPALLSSEQERQTFQASHAHMVEQLVSFLDATLKAGPDT